MLYYIIGILAFLLLISIWFCIKFGLVIVKMQDALEESLDLLDQKYNNLSKILEIPIFYDSQEVRKAVREVEDAKNIILYIANKITQSVEEKAVIEDDKSDTVSDN
jgi:hypothetical protein